MLQIIDESVQHLGELYSGQALAHPFETVELQCIYYVFTMYLQYLLCIYYVFIIVVIIIKYFIQHE